MTLAVLAIIAGSTLILVVATCAFSRAHRVERFRVDMKRLELATRDSADRLNVSGDPAIAFSITAARTFCIYADRLSVWTLVYLIVMHRQNPGEQMPEATSGPAKQLSDLSLSALTSRIIVYVIGETASGLVLSLCMKMFPPAMANQEITKIAGESIESVTLSQDRDQCDHPLPLALAQ